VALLAKPKTDNPDADGVLAILYGFAVMKKETTVYRDSSPARGRKKRLGHSATWPRDREAYELHHGHGARVRGCGTA
jgi:hypothetical protein